MELQFGHQHFEGVLTLDDVRVARNVDAIIEQSRSLVESRTTYDGFTIDPVGALDLDDGFSVEELDNGSIRIGVHIPNTGALILPGDEVYDIALARGVTEYFATGGSDPMLPRQLSEDALSLLPGKPRPTVAAFFTYSEEFSLQGCRAELTGFNNVRKFSYSEADQSFGESSSQFQRPLAILLRSALALYNLRQVIWKLPKIDLNQPTLPIHSEEGFRMQVPDDERIASFIVQEHMIATGRFFRELCPDGSVLSRNHRNSENATIQGMIREFEIDPKAPDAQDRLRQLGDLLSVFRTRTLPRATYGAENEGHYGLGLAAYGHATSPLRRAADHPIHAVLHGILSGNPVEVDYKSLVLAGQILTKKTHESKARQRGRELEGDPIFNSDEGVSQLNVNVDGLSKRRFVLLARLAISSKKNIEGLSDRVEREILGRENNDKQPTPMLLGTILFESNPDHPTMGETCQKVLERLADLDSTHANLYGSLIRAYFQETGQSPVTEILEIKNSVFQATVRVEKEGKILHATFTDTRKVNAERRAWVRLALVQHGMDTMPEVSAAAQTILDNSSSTENKKKSKSPRNSSPRDNSRRSTVSIVNSPTDEQRLAVTELLQAELIPSPMTLLTEVAKLRGGNSLSYRTSTGSDGGSIVCELTFCPENSEPLSVIGKGNDRQSAEQAAAILAIQSLTLQHPREDVHALILTRAKS